MPKMDVIRLQESGRLQEIMDFQTVFASREFEELTCMSKTCCVVEARLSILANFRE
jgi:hypothetical protein